MRWLRNLIGAPVYRRFLWRQLDEASRAKLMEFDETPFLERDSKTKLHLLVSASDIASLVHEFVTSKTEFDHNFADADVDGYVAVPGLEAFPRAAAAYICSYAYHASQKYYPMSAWRTVALAVFDVADKKRAALIQAL